TEVIGKLGDRHASIKGFDLPDELNFPIAGIPFQGNLLAADFNKKTREFELLYPNYPKIISIDKMPVGEILQKTCLRDASAPKAAFFQYATNQLMSIEESYAIMGKTLPSSLDLGLKGENGDTLISVPLEEGRRAIRWEDEISLSDKSEWEISKEEAEKYFVQLDGNIAYIHLPRMFYKDETPPFFDKVHSFFEEMKNTKALVIDIRGNAGGGRELINTLAEYIVHPDSIHVVNAARKRVLAQLTDKQKKGMEGRFLFPFEQLDAEEQAVVNEFQKTFKPIYNLPDDKFSEYHYMILMEIYGIDDQTD
ncbi:MAG: S41 family peptidase, partial [Saprospiraceae bacterium]